MLQKAKDGIKKVTHHLEVEYSKLQLGIASPSLVEDIMVDSYGTMQPLSNVSSITCLDNQTLNIKPWDKTILTVIAKAIQDSGLGLNPQSMADSIMIKIPPMTEERRKDVVKVVKKMLEDSKVSLRNVRHDTLKDIKSSEKEKEVSEDEGKDLENDLQKLIDEANKHLEDISKKKSEDVMKI